MSAPPRVNYGDISTESPAPPVLTSGANQANVSGYTALNTALVGGVRPILWPDELKSLERYAINLGVQQAMLNAIATSPDGLSVRPFIPDVDFIDGNSNTIGKREWVQPWSGTYTNVSAGTAVVVYQTSNATRYDRKVMVIWGLSVVNVGNQRTAGVIDTSSIIFSDTAGNTYDIWDPQRLDTSDALYAYAPIIYPNSRTAKIQFLPKYGASGAFEVIHLIGRIIEPVGDNIQGVRSLHS
jgi:hypothetical protein